MSVLLIEGIELAGPSDVLCLALSPRFLVAGHASGCIYLYEVASFTIFKVSNLPSALMRTDLHPISRYAIRTSPFEPPFRWPVSTTDEILRKTQVLSVGEGPIHCLALNCSEVC